jgi:hypothetical protein
MLQLPLVHRQDSGEILNYTAPVDYNIMAKWNIQKWTVTIEEIKNL